MSEFGSGRFSGRRGRPRRGGPGGAAANSGPRVAGPPAGSPAFVLKRRCGPGGLLPASAAGRTAGRARRPAPRAACRRAPGPERLGRRRLAHLRGRGSRKRAGPGHLLGRTAVRARASEERVGEPPASAPGLRARGPGSCGGSVGSRGNEVWGRRAACFFVLSILDEGVTAFVRVWAFRFF